MKISLRSLLAAAGLLVAAAGVQAEEVSLSPKFEPFSDENVTLVSHCTDACGDAGSCCSDSCGSCCSSRHVGRDFFVCKDRCGGLVGGFEYLYLKPFASEGLSEIDGVEMNYNPSYRYWIGWQNADGLGARLRYWEFDRAASNGATGISLEYRTFDLEMTQAVDFRRWNLLLAGGVRYAETGYGILGTAPVVGAVATDIGFDGMGLTFATQATRDLNRSGSLRMGMGARWSSIYGNSKVTTVAGTLDLNDDLMNVVELNIGPQYRRCLRNGAYLTFANGLEAQYYHNGLHVDTQDTGFFGFASSIAITR